MMVDSKSISTRFYASIGAAGLAARTTPAWDNSILLSIQKRFALNQKILDVGCGYGRITVPLAIRGYNIAGVDLSTKLIKDAKQYAKVKCVHVPFKVGNMCHLPYKRDSFDAILCLWSAFNELLTVKEQVAAIASMKRVLKPGGVALLEGSLYVPPATQDLRDKRYYGRGHRIRNDLVEGIRNDHYNHDSRSLRALMKRTRAKKFKIFVGDWAGRKRLFLEFTK